MRSTYIPIVGSINGNGLPAVATVTAEATVEAAVSLTNAQKAMLLEASTYGRISLRVFASGKSGSPSFTIDSLQGSFDDANFVTLQPLAPISVTANGELALQEITAHCSAGPQGLRQLKVLATVSALSPSHYISLFVGLSCQVFTMSRNPPPGEGA